MQDNVKEIRDCLMKHIEELEAHKDLYVKHPGVDFSRDRKLPFRQVILFLLTMEGKSLNKELLNYFDFGGDTPTAAALVQQRHKLKSELFKTLFESFVKDCATSIKKLVKGYRCFAIDGTVINIAHNPLDEETYLKSNQLETGYNQLHLNALFDLDRQLYTDVRIQGRCTHNEREALIQMASAIQDEEPCLIIADRGYESYNIFAHLEENKIKYVIRVKDMTSRNSISSKLSLPKTATFDEEIQLILTPKQTNVVKQNPHTYRFVPSTSRFDFFKKKQTLYYDLKFRVVRFKISEDSYETLITNTTQKEFPMETLKELYHKRWGIETSFRELKYEVGLAHLHSKTKDFVRQEIYSKLLMYNFSRMIFHQTEIKALESQPALKANFSMMIYLCKKYIRKETIPIISLIQKYKSKIRENRKFKRKLKSKTFKSFNYRC